MSFLTENTHFFERMTYTKSFKMPSAHFHNKHELYILLKGSIRYLVDDTLFSLSTGEMIFVEAGKFHLSYADLSTSLERILISFDDKFINDECIGFLNNIKKYNHIKILNEHSHKINSILDKMTKENNRKMPGYESMQKLYLHQLLVLIDRYRIRPESEELSKTQDTMQRAVKYISENCHEKITLENIAHIHSMSPGYFSKQFKKTIGTGLNEYINVARVARAEHLLLTTNLSITEIAMQCGFNDGSYFTVIFKSIKGITPKSYQLSYKK